jgi:hypothetical protein
MPSDTSTYLAPARKLKSKDPWILLASMSSTTPPVEGANGRIRLAQYNANVTWPASGGHIYYPVDVTVEPIEESLQGDAPRLSMVIVEPPSELVPYFQNAYGFIDKYVTFRIVDSNQLGQTTPRLTRIYQIYDVDYGQTPDREEIIFELGQIGDLSRVEPHEFYEHDCRFVYGISNGGFRCGFNDTRAKAPTTCDRTYLDCTAHGDWEVANGFKRTKPDGFGGFRMLQKKVR